MHSSQAQTRGEHPELGANLAYKNTVTVRLPSSCTECLVQTLAQWVQPLLVSVLYQLL